MVFLIVLFAVLFVVFVILFVGMALAAKDKTKLKKLQKDADYIFKKKNGAYKFFYTIKGFNGENGKTVKVILQSGPLFSNLTKKSTYTDYGCKTIQFGYADNRSDAAQLLPLKEVPAKEGQSYTVNEEFVLPGELLDETGAADIHVTIRSAWVLGGKNIDEVLEFDYNK